MNVSGAAEVLNKHPTSLQFGLSESDPTKVTAYLGEG